MLVLTKEVAKSLSMDTTLRLRCEASDLRAYGVTGWPTRITTTLGTGQPLEFDHMERDADDDILWVRYRQDDAVELTIFND